MGEEQGLARVVFPLAQDEDGWPPVTAERVWAHDVGDGHYRIDNAPWFVRDLAVGDVVQACAAEGGQHPTFVRVLQPSEHLTIRVVCFRAGPLRGSLQAVLDRFVPLGVYAEGLEQYGIVALDVPLAADKRGVHLELVRGAADGSWEWEEGRINDAWEAAKVEPVRSGWWKRRRDGE